MTSIDYIVRQPWGVIVEADPQQLYDKLTKETVLVAHEGFDVDAKHVLSLNIENAFNTTTHVALLADLLGYHKTRVISKQMAFCPVSVIVIEVESLLTAEAEYCLLMYAYLLRTGSTLPRLYVLFLADVKATTELSCRLLRTPPLTTSSSSVCVRDHYVNAQDYFDIAKRATVNLVVDSSGAHHELYRLLTDDLGRSRFVVSRRLSELIKHLGQHTDCVVCLDATIRVTVSSLYAGNRRIKKPTSIAYLAKAIDVIKRLRPGVKVVVMKPPEGEFVRQQDDDTITDVCRETMYRDFANDAVFFSKHMVSLRMLYTNYSPEDNVIYSRIAQAESLLDRLRFDDRERNLLTVTRMHPVVAKIVFLWSSKGKPLFPILLFAAAIQAFDKTTREVKEHGLKEVDDDFAVNCRLGETMKKALTAINKWQAIDTAELGELGNILKRLVIRFSETSDSRHIAIGSFDLNRFRTQLTMLIREHFSAHILTRAQDGVKTGTIVFHNSKHPQISWKVANSPPFDEIFPLISMLERTGHRVLLFLPLSTTDHRTL